MGGERRVLLGSVSGVFGVRGWIKLLSHTEPREALFDYLPWTLRTRGVERVVDTIEGRVQGRGLVARLDGVASRDAAQELIGSEIWVSRDALPAARPDQFYWVDLEGLQVFNVAGLALGTVSHLFATGANDVLVVKDDAQQRLIPFITGDVVKRVDIAAGRIEVDWDFDF